MIMKHQIIFSLCVCFTILSADLLAQSGQDAFKRSLQVLCGKAYQGEVVAAPEGDTLFAGKTLVMHVMSCEEHCIQIPFFVGEDRSRTWVLTFDNDRILLKHDHRKKDGKPDEITMYGGWTSNSGSSTMQTFPADQETADLLPAAATNVWWITIQPGEHFTYNLRRMGTDRYFSVKFDLSREVETPEAPWGFEE